MHVSPEPDSADEVFRAVLEPRARGRARRALAVVTDVVLAQVGGTLDQTRACDVVVRRRGDDAEVVRLPVSDPDQAAVFLHQVRGELVRLDPAAFRAAWGIDPPG